MNSRRLRHPVGLLLTIAVLGGGAPGAAPAVASAAPTDWTTYQHDPGRTGVDPVQPPTASVSPAWTSPALDGAVYAQPLVVNGRVLVATEGNTVYSINVSDGSVAWQKTLGPAVTATGFPCGDINPIGITSTPVVDTATNVLYAVALLASPIRHELFALSLLDGSILWSRAADAPGADAVVHNQRGALALTGGQVFIPFGGRAGDCGSYRGRVVAWPADGSASQSSYTVPTAREGAIWSPAGPTVDAASGQLLVATGNSASTTAFDFGESVIRLSPALGALDFFAPSNWASLNSTDTDIGSTGPTLLPNRRVFQSGKAGVGYLLAADALGGVGGQLFSGQVCASGGAYGGTAWIGSMIFVPCSDGLVALAVAPEGASFSVAWRGPAGFAGPPIVSGGKIWTLYRAGTIYALSRADGHVAFQAAVSGLSHFSAPSSGSGLVFAAANGGIAAFRSQSAPAVSTGVASAITATTAAVAGTVDPLSAAVSAISVQYGPTTAYGSTAPVTPATLPAGGVPQPVSVALSGLPSATVIHYRLLAANAVATGAGLDQTFTTLAAPTPTPAGTTPTVTGASQSRTTWRTGTRLARFAAARRSPVGTKFSFRLNEQATVRFAFLHNVAGRRVSGRCVAGTKKTAKKPSCLRRVTAGRLTFGGHPGLNQVSFQGRISRSKRLALGRYRLMITASAAGRTSLPVNLSFTIVKK